MTLRAKKPEPVNKRLKLFLYGGPGIGKTTAAISFPDAYIIDGERGCEHYDKQIVANGGEVFPTVNAEDAIQEVRALGSEKHRFRTLVIDPINALEADLIERAEKEFGAGDMRIWGTRDRTLRRLVNLIMSLDMNVVVTTHGKQEYGEKMVKLGTTFDGWKRLPYVFDLAIELERRGTRRVGIVKKTRLPGFIDGETFDFSYAEVARRYGTEVVERASQPVAIATAEQITALKALIDTVKLEEGAVEGWLRKAGVDTLEDLPGEIADKCIAFIKNKIAKAA